MKTSEYTDAVGTVAPGSRRVSPDEQFLAILRQAEGGMPVYKRIFQSCSAPDSRSRPS